MKDSGIAWTNDTANFWWGCQKVSDGCKHCYAEKLSNRYGKSLWGPPQTTDRELKLAIWKDIVKWDKQSISDGTRRRVFVSSMSDFFEDHPTVTQWRNDAMALLENLKATDILLLTKRPENAPRFAPRWINHGWPDHVWFGTTTENQTILEERINPLLDINSKVHFLSVEPLLGEMVLDLRGKNYGINCVDWVIVGGESQPGCRPMEIEWAENIVKECLRDGVPVFVKQLGGHPDPRHDFEKFPVTLQYRQLLDAQNQRV